MKLKLTKDGHAVVKNGLPVYIRNDGTEQGIDGAAAWKLVLSKHFEASPVMASLKIPHDVATAFFGDHFKLEGGKLMAVDKLGIQRYSSTRFGEAADFDEAFAQIVDGYKDKAMILKEPGTSAPAATPAPGEQGGKGVIITRAQFDAMPPAGRGRFMNAGGRIGDVASGGSPAPASRAGSITRSQFDVLGPKERAQHFGNGGKISD